MSIILKTTNLCKSFNGQTAVNNISLNIERNSVYGLLGPNGAGKSTTFDVCGIEIRVLDEELAEALKQLPEQSRNIVLMFFFLDMSDSEIGEKLNINRSTSYRHRRNSLEEIRKQLKEKKQDEE